MIEQDLQQYYEKDLLNGLNLYLYGVILKEKNRKDEAKQVFLQSLNKSPMLWSAWLELSSLLSQKEADYDIVKNMRSHWMKNFYFASFHLEAQQEKDCINLNGALMKHFPNAVYLIN